MLNMCSATPKLLACLIIFSTSLAADPDAKAAARNAALEWLALTESNQYSESWGEAGSLFKINVSRMQWLSTMRSVRTPLGPMQSRSFVEAGYKTDLPGMPDGKYVIQYRTSFENKADAVETIASTPDSDGLWRVLGYFIRQGQWATMASTHCFSSSPRNETSPVMPSKLTVWTSAVP